MARATARDDDDARSRARRALDRTLRAMLRDDDAARGAFAAMLVDGEGDAEEDARAVARRVGARGRRAAASVRAIERAIERAVGAEASMGTMGRSGSGSGGRRGAQTTATGRRGTDASDALAAAMETLRALAVDESGGAVVDAVGGGDDDDDDARRPRRANEDLVKGEDARDYARRGEDSIGLRDDVDVERWVRRGFECLHRFATIRSKRRDSRATLGDREFDTSVDAPAPPLVDASGGLDEAKQAHDLDVVRRMDDETSESVHNLVKSWLAEQRDAERAMLELAELVRDDNADLLAIQRRELLTRALGAWCEFRDVTAALELGVEEFRLAEKRTRFYLRENEMCYKHVTPPGDSKALEIVLNKHLDHARNSFAVAAPSAKEIERHAKECVLATRALNSCDGDSSRVVDKAYADRALDVKVILRDVMRDLKRSFRAITSAASGGASSTNAGATSTNYDVEGLHRRIQPVMDRYKSTALDGVVDRVVRALNLEGAHLAYGIELAKCATFVKVVSGAVKEHVKALDDARLEAALKAFEDDDDVLRGGDANSKRSAGGASSKKKRKSSSSKAKRALTKVARDVERDEITVADDAEDEPEAPTTPRSKTPEPTLEDAANSDSGGEWTAARSRRKPNTPPRPTFAKEMDAPRRPTVATMPNPPPLPPNPPPLPSGKPPARIPAPRSTAVAAAAPPPPPPPPPPPTGLSALPDFPPKPKVASQSTSESATPSSDAESAVDRESRLKEFPALKTNDSPALAAPPSRKTHEENQPSSSVPAAPPKKSTMVIPRPRPFAPPPPPTPPPRTTKTWAEAKRAIDGVKLPSLIKIK
jgi:hypothetical protein